MKKLLIIPLIFFLTACETSKKEDKLPSPVSAKIMKPVIKKYEQLKAQDSVYKVGSKKYKGFYVQPKAKGTFPGVLVVPEFWGLTGDMKKKAKVMASWGYAVFVVDLYGSQKHTSRPDKAQRWLNSLGPSKKVIKQFMAAFEKLKSYPGVNRKKVAVVGYTYGGALATEIARRGYAFTGVVNVHGAVGSKNVAKPGAVKSPVLWLKGQYDAYIPSKMAKKFDGEMKKAQAQVKVITYENAFNGFSNPLASKIGKKNQLPIKFDPKVSRAANHEIHVFLDKVMR